MRLFVAMILLSAVVCVSCDIDGRYGDVHEVDTAELPHVEPGSYGSRNLGVHEVGLVRGQVLYAPVYSRVPERNEQRDYALTATLSVRNTDLSDTITVHYVDYFDNDGRLVHRYLTEPRILGPLASTHFVVDETDRSGIGANFVVEWSARNGVTPPMVQTVMITSASTHGVSFLSPSQVLREW
jgi:hypothetical protein